MSEPGDDDGDDDDSEDGHYMAVVAKDNYRQWFLVDDDRVQSRSSRSGLALVGRRLVQRQHQQQF